MRFPPALPSRAALILVAAAAPLLTACGGVAGQRDTAVSPSSPSSASVPPLAHAGLDYQLGGAYTPPKGVGVVVRDHTASPAPGAYNVCYVNAFQAQPGAEDEWDPDLLLRDSAGDVVVDKDWDEAVLDIGTAGKRERVARRVNAWIDSCADKGFDAVEPDNYDTYTRVPDGLLSAADAEAFASLLAAHAHARGLAIGQKNTAELAKDRERVGFDFAVVEECGQYEECGTYTRAFGDRVLVIEYTAQGMRRACDGWGDELAVVRRDLDLVTPDDEGYTRATCADP
ncbi:endo alpha-1,4 polygalactosaminidase [Streptomyces laurentii]|uniref:endo alpha-1,4 polygalactosaminidase n=1 Tax=Streptomyces laurentii TaxID=39478 RepID=UPI00340839D7